MTRSLRPLLATTLIFLFAYMLAVSQQPAMLSTRVLGNFLTDNAFLGIAAVGMTFVILSGGIDLSVGAVIGTIEAGSGAVAAPAAAPASAPAAVAPTPARRRRVHERVVGIDGDAAMAMHHAQALLVAQRAQHHVAAVVSQSGRRPVEAAQQ